MSSPYLDTETHEITGECISRPNYCVHILLVPTLTTFTRRLRSSFFSEKSHNDNYLNRPVIVHDCTRVGWRCVLEREYVYLWGHPGASILGGWEVATPQILGWGLWGIARGRGGGGCGRVVK